jgi:hypothetical protein
MVSRLACEFPNFGKKKKVAWLLPLVPLYRYTTEAKRLDFPTGKRGPAALPDVRS